MRHWFYGRHFFPRDLERVPAWQDLSHGAKEVYRFLCWNSYLVKRSPTHRYCEWTYAQIAKQVRLSPRHVARIMKRLMKESLIYRWYAGDSGSNTSNGRPRPPRYEIPASRGMIYWWHRTRDVVKKVSQKVQAAAHEIRKRKDRAYGSDPQEVRYGKGREYTKGGLWQPG